MFPVILAASVNGLLLKFITWGDKMHFESINTYLYLTIRDLNKELVKKTLSRDSRVAVASVNLARNFSKSLQHGDVKPAFFGSKIRNMRRTLLLVSTACGISTACGMVTPAFANDASVGGVPVPVGPGFNLSPTAIWVPLPVSDTVVTVDTEDLNGPFNTVWVTGSVANSSVTVSSGRSVTSTLGWGIAVSATSGNITIDNKGTVNSVLHAIYAPGSTGTTTINSAGTLNATGLLQAGIYANATSGNILADGQGTGRITGAFNGVEVATASLAAGQGNITIQNFKGGITGGNDGISANFGAGGTLGNVVISGNGNITGTLRNGIETYTNGNTMITNNGNVTGAINGIAANFAWASPGNVTISGNGDATGGATGSGIVAGSGTGNITISAGAKSTGGAGIWGLSSLGGNVSIDGAGTGVATGSVTDGVLAQAFGNATVSNFATVTGFRNGIYVLGTDAGKTTSIQGNGLVGGVTGTGALSNGIVVGPSLGDVNIGTVATNGAATGVANGIWVNNGAAAGNINIVQNRNTTGTLGNGIFTSTGTGTTNITATGANVGNGAAGLINGWGIAAQSTSGAININGGGTGTATGGQLEGIGVTTTAGATTIQNFATVTGFRNGIWVLGSTGTTSIQGNGLTGGVTGTAAGSSGIVVGPSAGNVSIGTTATNGVITGALHGIWANNTVGAGTIAIKVDKNVTGTAGDGIFTGTLGGNQTIDILAPAIVRGGLYGLATGTTTGLATTNNLGTIQNIGDGVGAAGTAGLQAVWLGTGNNTLNNNSGGKIIGGFTTGGINNTLNNNAGGTWTPSLANTFAGTNDQVNNTGLINVRTGYTTFTGLERLTNKSGGVIDLTYGGTQATNTLLSAFTFAPEAGSTLKLAFDTAKANNAGLGLDASSHGKGTADTVLAATAVTPGAKSNINLTTIGSVDSLIGTSGSVALVQAGTSALGDPGKGGVGTFVASSNYTLVGDPTTGAVKFNLSDAAGGGVFLQWAPNITSATMGAFGGGDLTTKGGRGSAIGAARSGVSGASSVASMLGGFGATAATCQVSDQRSNVWTTLDAGGSTYKGGGSGSNIGGALGIETQIGKDQEGCGQTAAGLFGYANSGKTKFATGQSDADGYGAGAYVRTANESGFYASLMGTVGKIDSRLTNRIFQSTAKSDALGLMGDATAGIIKPIGEKAKLDVRGSVSYLSVDADSFTDTKGITVKDMKTKMWTLASSIGVIVPAGDKSAFYVRGGVKYSDVSRKTNAYDVIISNSGDEVTGTGEIGLNSQVSGNTSFGIGGYGDFSKSTTNYGGRVSLRVAF
jgi:hypothetical protein